MSKKASTSSQAEATTLTQFPAAKVTAVSRLKSFTGSLVGKRKPKAPKSTVPELVFPPPSWDIQDFNPSSTNWTIPSLQPETPSVHGETGAAAEGKKGNAAEIAEPMTLAKRLRTMIELLPIPGNFLASASTTPTTEIPTGADESTPNPPSPPSESATPPIPPDMDANLIQILSSEEVMNGDSQGKGKGRPGIWSLLAGLRRTNGSRPEGSPIEEHEGGVMMYAPLVPQSDSVVELARTETVHATDTTPQTTPSSSTTSLPHQTGDVQIWVPSTTELSVLTTWWGYRLYLPPPVMAKLGSTSVKAAARAAMITSALKWLIDKIPILLIPPQFRPAIKMLKTLAPFAGYVGVFIAWSWDRIRQLDEGNGVVLTATWLLPVALIPMAWDAGDIYRPHLPPTDLDNIPPVEVPDINTTTPEVKDDTSKAKVPEKKPDNDPKPSWKSRFVW